MVSPLVPTAGRDQNRPVPPPPLPSAELAALSSSLDNVAGRIGEVASTRRTAVERGRDAEDSVTAELDAIEAMLRNANRRLGRLLRRS